MYVHVRAYINRFYTYDLIVFIINIIIIIIILILLIYLLLSLLLYYITYLFINIIIFIINYLIFFKWRQKFATKRILEDVRICFHLLLY